MTGNFANRKPLSSSFLRLIGVLLLLGLALLLAACRQTAQPTPTPGPVVPPGPVVVTPGEGVVPGQVVVRSVSVPLPPGSDGSGLQIRLGEGDEQPAPVPLPPVADSVPLVGDALQALLSRLPALVAETGDQQDFALPPSSLPPPRPGETIQEPFPPPVTAPAPDPALSEPLAVLRYSPQGDLPLAPYLSVTFNQPMVALTGLQDLAAQGVPVTVSPEPPGTWRWVGTKTLFFQPDLRFPMATDYTATIPAGTRSATGQELAQDFVWTFSTPPPKLVSYYPEGGPQPLDPIMVAAFDQRIDAQAVLATITLAADGQPQLIRLATAEELQADKAVQQWITSVEQGQWLAFKATEPLPSDAAIQVTVGPGAPSAEGPRTTQAAQNFGFRTFGPLEVARVRCGWQDYCPPLTPWFVEFSNPLDPKAFQASMVQIDPPLPTAEIMVLHDTLQILGPTAGRTRYQVTLNGAVADIFGQTLGKDQTLSFDVGSAQPMLFNAEQYLVTLDPTTPPVFSVFSINYRTLQVKAYAVEPADWSGFKLYLEDRERNRELGRVPAPPGREVLATTLDTDSQPDALTETTIDLSGVLPNGRGQLILVIQPEGPLPGSEPIPDWYDPIIQVWVQATDIALDAFVDQTEMLAWANSLVDGAPLADVSLSLLPGGPSAGTDSSGLATLALPGVETELLVGRLGDDVALLPANPYRWRGGGWNRWSAQDDNRWYVFDDRQMYRPGEEVHLKGWIRRIDAGEGGDVNALPSTGSPVGYRVVDPQGNELFKGTADLTALGGFSFSFTIPEEANLGPANVELSLAGRQEYGHSFQIQEFRRPEFEVTASASQGPHFVGGHATVEVTAAYFAGGPLPNAEVNWTVSSQAGDFRPPGWDDFEFGTWTPWWQRWPGPDSFGMIQQGYQSFTDAGGVHRLRIDFDAMDPPQPTSVTAEATVIDVNRQAWTARSLLLVHPADRYVGLRSPDYFVQQGDPLLVDAIVTDLDGNAISGHAVEVQAARLRWQFLDDQWQEVEAEVQSCSLTSGAEALSCRFDTEQGGTYRITAKVSDEMGRPNQSQIMRWVSGGEAPPSRQVEQEEVLLIPDRESYQPGDVAKILVQAPFAPAEGVLTLRRSGIVFSMPFHMEESSLTLEVPIEAGYLPNIYAQVDLVGAAIRTGDQGEPLADLPRRPAFAMGTINLSVPPLARTLDLEVLPLDSRLEPGGSTTVEVMLRDATGQPVAGAELAIAVVDEAVLALSSYELADPIAIFYSERSPDGQDFHQREQVLLASIDQLLAGGAGAGAADTRSAAFATAPAPAMAEMAVGEAMMMNADAAPGSAGAPIALRSDFNPLAAFEPAVPTDGEGRASIDITLPDNLTRYRVMVVAVAGANQFGKGESAITARLPLMVRPSAPRFLNFGDRFQLPVVVQNQTDEPLDVDVALEASNLILIGDQGRRLTVPANDRVEVRFPAATDRAGIVRVQVAVASGAWADAAQVELPVWTPATTEAFAVYGEIDQGAIAQPVIAPSDVFTQFGGLEITTSSTALQALTDAFLYLTDYPYECSEQIASRILAVSALRDVLAAFKAEGLPPPAEIEAAVLRDIQKLQGMQNFDGGFSTWRRGVESWPFNTVHVTHALLRARESGYEVPSQLFDQALNYLRTIEQRWPSYYSLRVKQTILAYALNVRWQAGDSDPARARRLVGEAGLENLSFDAIGWLLPVLGDDPASQAEVQAIRGFLNNRVAETASTAQFVTGYSAEEGYLLLHSDRRADGILLDALIGDQPDSDLIPKLVRGLLANRTRGRWGNTQENVFILLAMDRYFKAFEGVTPDFVARAWLGDRFAGEAAFQGRTTEYRVIDIPMAYLAQEAQTSQDLVLAKDGAGRLYYRLGVRYAPRDLNLPPTDQGFTVQRSYEGADDPADVWRDEAGVWHMAAGARVRVRLTLVAPARRYHVALVDPLPAGLEALNPALAVTAQLPPDPQDGEAPYRWWWRWYEHQNLRDDRAEAFTSLLWEGVYSYSYLARATTPGEFVVPPAKAEEMYAPETFGRGAGDRVVVEG